MTGRRLKLVAREDFVRRLSQASANDAMEELIWNAFDENARSVAVELKEGELGRVEEITVIDDGDGLPYSRAAEAFQNLGQSNKVSRRLNTGESLHGQKGEGRHKALSLGSHVTWRFRYRRDEGHFSFDIEGTAGRPDPFYLTSEGPIDATEGAGCTVTISGIQKSRHSLLYAHSDIAARFAQFLLTHGDRQLIYNGKPVRPQDVISGRRTLRAFHVQHDGSRHRVSIQIIHWSTEQAHREVFFCDESGIPRHRAADSFLAAGSEGTVFIRSSLFGELHGENLLQTFETSADTEKREIVSRLWKRVRKYFADRRQANDRKTLEQLKDEGSYPYRREPRSEIDQIERRVFDLCTINISRHLPTFHEGMDVGGRRLLLRMVQEALTQNPTAVGRIIREVCNLPDKEADRFASLIDDLPLTSIVNAAHQVSTRLEFLKSFKSIVYLNPFETAIRERTGLQRLLIPNSWLFGEEYAVGTDDQSIRAVLEEHVSILGRDHLQPEMKDADLKRLLAEFNKDRVKTPISLDRIPDIMLWRQFKERRPDEYEFLVVEIKRPGVPIGRDEHAQIEDYARAVTSTPIADFERTRWVFIVVSDRLSSSIEELAHQQNLPPYTTMKPSHGKYEIRAMPWSVIIQSAEGRHEHLRQWLNHNISTEEALKRTKAAYGELLPESVTQPSEKKRQRRKSA